MDGLKVIKVFLAIAAALSAICCSVISREIRSEALPEMPFDRVIEDAENYIGQTVLLGGFILKTENTVTGTILTVLQAPLDYIDEPMSKDLSQGRFLVYHDRYLDPEVFRKHRAITVAGRILPCQEANCHKPYLRIESREIHLWPEYERSSYPYPGYFPYPGFVPYSYPYSYYYPYGYPGFRYHPYYWR